METNDTEDVKTVFGLSPEPTTKAADTQAADARTANPVRQCSYDGASDADDKRFIIRGWLLAIYWIMNVAYIIGFFAWIGALSERRSYYGSGGGDVWMPIILLPIMLFLNRLSYELAIAVFEGIKHLRQIRDELRKINARVS